MWIAWILTVVIACTAVRVDDVYSEERGNNSRSGANFGSCIERCTAVGLGRYEVRGRNASWLSQQLRPETRYFVGSCDGLPAMDAEASVVQWLDAKDPVNNSSMAVYLNPLLEKKLRGQVTNLCAVENVAEQGGSRCLCQLTGALGVGSLATLLPPTISQKLVAMERCCPGGVLNLLAATAMALALLVVGVTLHALLRAWKSSKSQRAENPAEFEALRVKTPMENFVASYSWAVGFVTSLAGLQMGGLVFVRKSSDLEESVWFVAAFPVILAVAGALRLMILLCKQQLAHACLKERCVLTKSLTSSRLDIALLIMMAFYLTAVLTLVASNLQGLLVASVALAGSAWALLKAIQTARELEAKLHLLEVNSEKLAESDVSGLKFIPWASLILAGRRGQQMSKFLESPSAESAGSDFNIRDILWQNRSICELTGSRAAFLILPSLAALVAMSLGISALHMALYACSCGELSNLQMASALQSLNFRTYQDKYDVMLDISFRQVAIVASAPVASTQWINFTQPFADDAPEQHMVSDRSSSATVEIHLPPRRVPRVADVRVQGLRPSLGATEYQVRFSPLTTVPTLLEIETKEFQRRVVWSTLPGSTISVPSGVNNFTMRVMLSDYFLNLPLPPNSVSNLPLWTEFSPMNASESACSSSCRHSLNCFDYFLAEAGCFFIRGNRSQLSASMAWSSDLSAAGLRNLSGHLFGCTNGAGEPGACGNAALAVDGMLTFNEVRPDWRDKEATLTFTLVLEVGEQRFRSEVGTVQLHRGPPLPSDALAVLLGDSVAGIEVIDTTTAIDPLGNVVVNVSRYDPMKVQTLRLLVVPLLSDGAFTVGKPGSGAAVDARYFQQSQRCLDSPFLQRYSVCGATGGWEAEPINLSLDQWTGQPDEGDQFSIFSQEDGHKQHRVASGNIFMAFQGVDSPAAWAVADYGMTLLNETDGDVERSIFSSADATLGLLQLGTASSSSCELVEWNALGVDNWTMASRGPPLLRQDHAVKVMLGLSAACDVPNNWTYSGVLQLNGHKLRLSLDSLLEQISQMEENQAMAFLRSMQVSSTSTSFFQDLATMAWQLQDMSLLPKVLRLLAGLPAMPRLLLEELLKSRRFQLEALQSEPELKLTAENFGSVQVLKAMLHDPKSLGLVALACSLSPKLERLLIRCQSCFGVTQKPLARHWQQMSPCLGRLKSFKMTWFTITDFPMDLFEGNAATLQTLDLTSNKISRLPRQLPESLRHLKKLKLSHNQFFELPENTFQHLTEIEELTLDQSQLTKFSPKPFEPLKKLKVLNLRGNSLSELPENSFDNLKELESLDLSQNHFVWLPENRFQHLRRLTHLSLKGNPLAKLPQKVFEHLVELKELGLHDTELTELPEKIFHGLTQLLMLSLGGAHLTKLPEKIFEDQRNLKNLELFSNKLVELPEKVLGRLENLETLDLAGNNLTELPDMVFQDLRQLRDLGLNRNWLTQLPAKVFTGNQQLQRLSLSGNQLASLPEKVFDHLQELKTLNLDGNQLTELPGKIFDDLKELESLFLFTNRLSELPEKVFEQLKELHKLLLTDNQLTELPPKIFAALRSLEVLDLRGNPLKELPEVPETVRKLGGLQVA